MKNVYPQRLHLGVQMQHHFIFAFVLTFSTSDIPCTDSQCISCNIVDVCTMQVDMFHKVLDSQISTLVGNNCFAWLFLAHTHTHTDTFNGPFSGTTRVSRYKRQSQSGFYWSERQWVASAGPCKSASHSRQTTTPAPQAGCPSCRPTNSVKALKANGYSWQ